MFLCFFRHVEAGDMVELVIVEGMCIKMSRVSWNKLQKLSDRLAKLGRTALLSGCETLRASGAARLPDGLQHLGLKFFPATRYSPSALS